MTDYIKNMSRYALEAKLALAGKVIDRQQRRIDSLSEEVKDLRRTVEVLSNSQMQIAYDISQQMHLCQFTFTEAMMCSELSIEDVADHIARTVSRSVEKYISSLRTPSDNPRCLPYQLISRSYLMNLIQRGEILAHKEKGRYVVDRESAARWKAIPAASRKKNSGSAWRKGLMFDYLFPRSRKSAPRPADQG